MNTPDIWDIQARAAIVCEGGRISAAIAISPDGVNDRRVVLAEAFDDGATVADAELRVIHALREHPDLNRVGVNLATNHQILAAMINADQRVAGSHVSIIGPEQCPPGDVLMAAAVDAAAAAAQRAGRCVLRAATDGARDKATKRGGVRSGYGWITEDGRSGYGTISTTCALEAELVAIERLLAHTSAAQPLVIEVDSRAAIKLARTALLGDEAPSEQVAKVNENATRATAAVLAKIRSHAGRDITLQWVKGHSGVALNEGANTLAGLGRSGIDLYSTPEMVEKMARRAVEKATREPALAAS